MLHLLPRFSFLRSNLIPSMYLCIFCLLQLLYPLKNIHISHVYSFKIQEKLFRKEFEWLLIRNFYICLLFSFSHDSENSPSSFTGMCTKIESFHCNFTTECNTAFFNDLHVARSKTYNSCIGLLIPSSHFVFVLFDSRYFILIVIHTKR